MSNTISIFKTLTSASTSAFTYGDNSGGARLFEDFFVSHTLDARNNVLSRYSASGRIVGLAVKGESVNAAHTIQLSIRQGSSAGPVGTLWSMSAGAQTSDFDGGGGGKGLQIRRGEVFYSGLRAFPPEGISFHVNTDNQDLNHKDLYLFVKAGNASVGDTTWRVDIELDHGRGTLKPHKRARFSGTSAGALY